MRKKTVVIIDYGIGNIFSVKQAFDQIGAATIITSDSQVVENAEYLVLPGVGAFSKAMGSLNNLKLVSSIISAAKRGVPLLGICLGMQMLLDESEEFGVTSGLGLISGRVERFPLNKHKHSIVKIPQINWHEMVPIHSKANWDNSILDKITASDAVYFIHSFVARPCDNSHVLASYMCGEESIPAVIVRKNVIGCQFHPEKSGEVGLQVLRNFIDL
jgi:imidazole glycerol-phosphate synthase subunit HisH